MAGISDSLHPDDIRLHLEVAATADSRLTTAPEGESESARDRRLSQRLPPRLRERLERVLGEVQSQAPGLSASQLMKLEATRAGRDAVKSGAVALSRVDSHLHSRLAQRNPGIGRKYGVQGSNPTSFGGVLRALGMSHQENARIAALPGGSPERELLFTPVIANEVATALAAMTGLSAQVVGTRADLSRAVSLEDATLAEARAVIVAVREHLYANLPDRRQDADLRDYGFRPVSVGGRGRRASPEEPDAPEA